MNIQLWKSTATIAQCHIESKFINNIHAIMITESSQPNTSADKMTHMQSEQFKKLCLAKLF